ncbi:MAG TPA: ABC transporter permease [Clostridia bacterium]
MSNIQNIPKEQFEFAQIDEKLHDKKFDTKPIGYFKDAFNRFRKNKASIVAAFIILFIVLFSIFVPMFSKYDMAYADAVYKNMLPKNDFLSNFGIFTGTYEKKLSNKGYENLYAIGVGAEDINGDNIDMTKGAFTKYSAVQGKAETYKKQGQTYRDIKIDSYLEVGFVYLNLNEETYNKILEYQQKTGLQILYPMVDQKLTFDTSNANWWYLTDERGYAIFDQEGKYQDIYVRDESGNVKYFIQRDKSTLQTRVLYYNYYIYKYGHEPKFTFGTNNYGQDILIRLAYGARVSLLLAVGVSIINFIIGALYGAVEGYYGGALDLILERVSDVLNNVPFIIVATLFQLYLVSPNIVPPIVALLFAFVMTGWIGIAYRVRTQFYRFKGQEYVLAARTLGAKDSRIMFKHIFPNTLGTTITSTVLIIPSVIFSESMLSYLGIVNLNGRSITSIGSMLADGQGYLSTYPHVIFFPALVISLLMISFNLFGNGLRDAFNPSLRGAEE